MRWVITGAPGGRAQPGQDLRPGSACPHRKGLGAAERPLLMEVNLSTKPIPRHEDSTAAAAMPPRTGIGNRIP